MLQRKSAGENLPKLAMNRCYHKKQIPFISKCKIIDFEVLDNCSQLFYFRDNSNFFADARIVGVSVPLFLSMILNYQLSIVSHSQKNLDLRQFYD